ncbi:glycosyltransferase [Draconibacterium sediminis]|uniref:Glycosyl transferase family 1 domain-containing protein n=1 Tax=Draconibacterium sediminis TaxID=1544798 RepID=A0A0D8JDI7_9BACT|nr:glycosyltransferase [Draconibacterium sediminis]KJF43883.1 hypothetical protein LH29_12510 [Draconibacterium sediminis]
MKTVYSLIYKLHEVSGVQKVLVDIHNGIKEHFTARIAGFLPYKVFSKYIPLPEHEYKHIKSILELKNSVVLTHERMTSSKCVLLNKFFNLNIKQIHIQHSTYESLRLISFYPQHVVSISDKITQNLVNYFKFPRKNIFKIHNGIVDEWTNKNIERKKDGLIHIAYIARVDSLKNQVKIVERFKRKISKTVHIDFIGNGPLFEDLKQITKDSTQFNALGFHDDVLSMLKNYDYVMLFSEKEGLPITLIEGTMCYKPLIVNDVGGCLEIGIPKINAFCAKSWENLIDILNSLENVSEQEYDRMAKSSREIFENNFTYNKMISKYLELINNVTEYN